MKLETWILSIVAASTLGLSLAGCRSTEDSGRKEAMVQDLELLREAPMVWGWTTASTMGGVEVQIEVAALGSSSWEIDSVRTWIVGSATLPNGTTNPQIASPVAPPGSWMGATNKQAYSGSVFARVEVRLRAPGTGAFVKRIYWKNTALTPSKTDIPFHSDVVEGP